MRAVTKRAASMERTKWQTVQKKSVYNTKHYPIKPDYMPLATYSMFKLPKNIGTGTVDHWLWIMDQELRAAFGQHIG